MNDEQITMVKESWDKVAPIASTAAALFYGRLFEMAPGVRAPFPDDMVDQKRKLMSTIGSIVRRLDGLDALDPQIHALALRHVSYGAVPAHYDAVGDCLLWTLDQGLGDDFTPELREAWIAAYARLAESMIAAAAAHRGRVNSSSGRRNWTPAVSRAETGGPTSMEFPSGAPAGQSATP